MGFGSFLSTSFYSVVNAIKDKATRVGTFFQNAASSVKNAVTNTVTRAKDAISENIIQPVRAALSSTSGVVKTVYNDTIGILKDVSGGVKNVGEGVKEAGGTLGTAFGGTSAIIAAGALMFMFMRNQ